MNRISPFVYGQFLASRAFPYLRLSVRLRCAKTENRAMRFANNVECMGSQGAENASHSPPTYNDQISLLLRGSHRRRLCDRVFNEVDIEVSARVTLCLGDLLFGEVHKESVQVGVKIAIRSGSVIRHAMNKPNRAVKLTGQVTDEPEQRNGLVVQFQRAAQPFITVSGLFGTADWVRPRTFRHVSPYARR